MGAHNGTKDALVWVIRAGKNGNAHDLFMKSNLVVLSDVDLGDLRFLRKERSAFYDAYASRHPKARKAAISGIGGKFFRFVHEAEIGDHILYPCLRDKKLYIGSLTSAYRFDPTLDSQFPHQRNVIWKIAVPKSSLSESAQRELGAARTFFRFKTHVAEIQRFLGRKLTVEDPK